MWYNSKCSILCCNKRSQPQYIVVEQDRMKGRV
nr:MAG TPA: hypothetical protein [Caudoviricetes sp.]